MIDYISGNQIRYKPEEESVQVFSKRLVEDYNYPKERIQTHPQYRVKVRPSDTRKSYPVDIAVFSNDAKNEDPIIIVECKKKNRSDGQTQLQDYLRLSDTSLGAWFNGKEALFIQKIEKGGRVKFEVIPTLPRWGQRIEDVGKHKRKDLKVTHNLKSIFQSVRNYLAGNNVGATRDEELAKQLINLIFCKLYDEKFTPPEEEVTFRAGIGEEGSQINKRIKNLFDEVKKHDRYKDVLDKDDTITLDNKSVVYVVGELQNYCLIEAERDVIADAFETFIGPALKGAQGQFFTPRNVVQMAIEVLDPSKDDVIIDPACGSGGFLIEALKHVWKKIDRLANELKWQDTEKEKEKQTIASNHFKGIDKDNVLSRVAKAYMTLVGDGKSGIVCEDSLERRSEWKYFAKQNISIESFDIVLTNPPFGSKIPVTGEAKLKQYALGHEWKKDKKSVYTKGGLAKQQAPQWLFIERCLQLLKEGGRMAIVLPDGMYGGEQLSYVRQWLLTQGRIVAIIDVPMETFMPNTSTKTSILIFQKISKEHIPENYPIFMCRAETCGHDRRGKEIKQDDLKDVVNKFNDWKKATGFSFT